jgi:hypothetical protein
MQLHSRSLRRESARASFVFGTVQSGAVNSKPSRMTQVLEERYILCVVRRNRACYMSCVVWQVLEARYMVVCCTSHRACYMSCVVWQVLEERYMVVCCTSHRACYMSCVVWQVLEALPPSSLTQFDAFRLHSL